MAVLTPHHARPAAHQHAPHEARPGFRPDLDALRAVAIVLVVLYHAHVPGLTGGFVGVDVFFVISGFLITRNLLAERASTGRVALGAFWARRLRRLVPAMSLMVAVTVVASMLVLTPLEWGGVVTAALSASLYVSNLHFAGLADDYFAAGLDASPLLHTWSLSVEEQFYVVWPLLIAGAVALGARRRGAAGRRALVAVLGTLTLASFALSAHQVAEGSPHAFYGLPSRTWEFAAAGLLAVATSRPHRRLPTAAATALALSGLALIAVPAVAYDGATAFPGPGALAPVAGTLAIIAAGSWSEITWRAATRPLRWLGRLSYSWYLWHWPAMVLLVAWADQDTVAVRLVAAAGSLVVAMASLRWVEDPVRRAPRLVGSGRATFAVAAACTLVALAAAQGLATHRADLLRGSFHGDIAAAQEKDYLDGCDWSTVDGQDICTVGDRDAERTVVLSGDSHAMSWTPGFDRAGKELGLRVLVRSASSCPGAPVPTISEHTGEVNSSCVEYRDATRALIDELRPELVVVVSSDFTRRVAGPDGERLEDRDEQLAAWAEALRTMRDELAVEGIAMGAVLDNPRISPDPLHCMEEERDLRTCGEARGDALRRVRLHVRNEAAVFGPEASLDTIGLVCGDDRCEIQVDGRYAYADGSHLAADFTADHSDEVVAFLQRFERLA